MRHIRRRDDGSFAEEASGLLQRTYLTTLYVFMHDWLRHATTGFLILLICFCIIRQRRYWREIKQNRPSGSVKCGYALACISISLAFAGALFFNSEESWRVFMSVLTMSLIFSLKITFSPAMIAITLAVCTLQFHCNGNFPLLEVWSGFVRMLTWRLPEEVRVAYATVSFAWVCLVLLFGGAATPSSDSAELALEGISDPLSSLS